MKQLSSYLSGLLLINSRKSVLTHASRERLLTTAVQMLTMDDPTPTFLSRSK